MTSKGSRTRHPLNAPGDFYVENEACITCLAPEHAAPDLMGFAHDGEGGGHCYFKRQPATDEETEQAIAAVEVSCCSGLRYGGTDDRIIRALISRGERDSCDHPSAESGGGSSGNE
jgi:hypothetical protein